MRSQIKQAHRQGLNGSQKQYNHEHEEIASSENSYFAGTIFKNLAKYLVDQYLTK